MLVDGEHYPPVIRDALIRLREAGTEPVLAVVLGGTEKVARHGADLDLGVPVAWLPRGPSGPAPDPDEAADGLARILAGSQPDVVVDRSDEPVLDTRTRMRLAAVALHAGVVYEGPDFAFTPPPRPRLADRPSIAVIGVGKRTGKTAITGALARAAVGAGRQPIVVAMGRGGPPDPVIVPAGAVLDPVALLAVADAGDHAASDFYEDAVTAGVTTVGARRCGGGLAGGVGDSNVVEAVAAATRLPGDLLLLEGSGAAVPPVHADATVLVVPGDADPSALTDHLGPYRLLLADLVVVTMAEPPRSSAAQVAAVLEAIRSISRRVPVLVTVFRPVPLGSVSGSRVLFATTAPAAVGQALADSLAREHGCEVVAWSHRLADRDALTHDLRSAPEFDVLLVELKAAAVDVAARFATNAGARVVFCDNRPLLVDAGEQPPHPGMDDGWIPLLTIADEKFAAS